ncbi:MAG: Ig-like domain-containing protein [Chloroflexi bacterium]|nr:Ig-like domain-containing protein [Chloroflexota bacterium]
MRPIRTVGAAAPATFESLGKLLSSHRGIARVSIAALSFTFIIAFSQEAPVTKAVPEAAPVVSESMLPQNVGIGVSTDASITIDFDAAMNPGSVEDALQLLPADAVRTQWSPELDSLTITPERRWRTSETYLVVVGESAQATDGTTVGGARRYSFTTQLAPRVTDFQVRLVESADESPVADGQPNAVDALEAAAPSPTEVNPPTKTATEVSATSAISISFSGEMDRADVESRFAITPAVEGDLEWHENDLVFRPSGRMEPGSRYTISVIGSHDVIGNVIGGKGNFSFIVQPGAQVTKTSPEADAADVEPATVELWFSQPMAVEATNKAFGLTDTSTGQLVGGLLAWNEAATQLIYTPDQPFAGGRTYEVTFDGGARDGDGNRVDASLSFSTKAAPVTVAPRATTSVRSAPVVPAAAPATSLAGYALNQVNAARAAYGFAPVVLDASVSAVASAHAWDQARNGYFSHTGANGSTRESRLRAGGVSFGWSGENQCYHVGMSEQATLDWCHSQFMAEPYPGHWNHIANILNPNARRMGVGIATVGGRTVITWNFTD